jgi:hypothetical protein
MRELHERDWSVKLRGGIDGLRAEALAGGGALAELEESATEAGAPAGTLIEWGPGYELEELEDRALLAQAGVVLAGPRYDPPPAGLGGQRFRRRR